MKYFASLEEKERSPFRSFFYEFQKGSWDEETCVFHRADSIYIHDNMVFDLDLDPLITQAFPAFDSFGPTLITPEAWAEFMRLACARGGEVAELAHEADAWAQETFEACGVFTILGI